MTEAAPQVAVGIAAPLLLLVGLALGFVMVIAIRRSSLGKVVMELGWLAAPALVLGTFMGISFLGSPVVHSSPSPPFQSYMPQAVIPVPTDDRTTSASDTHRPDWVDQPVVHDGITELIVFSSQQYTTREEAETELTASVAAALSRDLQQLHSGSGSSTWTPSSDDIRRHMIKQKYVEVIERDFGNFFHPMYRVWWQVELSPEVRTEFLPAWKQGMTAHRIRRVGVVAASIVLAASLIAMYRRMSVLMRESGTAVPQILTSAVAVLWVAIVVYQFRSMNL